MLIDSLSKGTEGKYMGLCTTTECTNDELRSVYSCCGLSEQLVSALHLISPVHSLQEAARYWTNPPFYHPTSNSVAERPVCVTGKLKAQHETSFDQFLIEVQTNFAHDHRAHSSRTLDEGKISYTCKSLSNQIWFLRLNRSNWIKNVTVMPITKIAFKKK